VCISQDSTDLLEQIEREREIVIEITWRKIFVLFVIGVPVILLLYITYGLLQAYYGPVNVIIEVAFDKSAYSPGESVIVSVKVSSGILGSLIKLPLGKAPIGIEVRNKDRALVFVGQSETDGFGETKFTFKVPTWATFDEYTVYLASPGGSNSAGITIQK